MKVSSGAISQLKQIIASQESPGIGVRIYTSSGCCGPNLHMSIVDKAEPGDKVINFDGVDFIIESEAEDMTKDLLVDYKDEKFNFSNRKPRSKCC